MIETLLITVAFCLGWRIVTDEGQLLYFIRKPFENIESLLENKQNLYAATNSSHLAKQIKKLKVKLYLAKPFVLCITCFGSIWGAAVYVTLNGIDVDHIPNLIINSVAASFIQTFIWVRYQKLINCNECN